MEKRVNENRKSGNKGIQRNIENIKEKEKGKME